MLWVNASFVLLLAGMLLTAFILLRRAKSALDAAGRLSDALDRKQCALEEFVLLAQRESERLEAVIARADVLEPRTAGDKLALLEALAEASSLEDLNALATACARTPPLPGGAASDLFDANEAEVALARLLKQGHSSSEIARRLGLPIGEVELRLSLRAA